MQLTMGVMTESVRASCIVPATPMTRADAARLFSEATHLVTLMFLDGLYWLTRSFATLCWRCKCVSF